MKGGEINNITKLEAAQVRLAFAKLLISESNLIDNNDIIIKICDLLTDKLLGVITDPRIKWNEWKTRHAPGEVQEPNFNFDQVNFTLDNLYIGDRYSVAMKNYTDGLINREEYEITDFNYDMSSEKFICEVILSDSLKLEFKYIKPGGLHARHLLMDGWVTRWGLTIPGQVINCSRIEPS
jgi:hypothetical protein